MVTWTARYAATVRAAVSRASGPPIACPLPGRILTVEFDGPPADREAPVTAEELQTGLRRVTGSADITVTEVHTATRFSDNARQAADYRAGRVLLAGDAAHVHPPFDGQGLNLGIGDGLNLGWKLAAVVRGQPPTGSGTRTRPSGTRSGRGCSNGPGRRLP